MSSPRLTTTSNDAQCLEVSLRRIQVLRNLADHFHNSIRLTQRQVDLVNARLENQLQEAAGLYREFTVILAELEVNLLAVRVEGLSTNSGAPTAPSSPPSIPIPIETPVPVRVEPVVTVPNHPDIPPGRMISRPIYPRDDEPVDIPRAGIWGIIPSEEMETVTIDGRRFALTTEDWFETIELPPHAPTPPRSTTPPQVLHVGLPVMCNPRRHRPRPRPRRNRHSSSSSSPTTDTYVDDNYVDHDINNVGMSNITDEPVDY
ncbi:hypothetical protein QCA50_007338 [Cerrena zonata]|uniref:Uncharacterized protein n=1 Tax=Cerrena zonata TaxID=2478898 RepID=A0AAW0G9R7_9APHY